MVRESIVDQKHESKRASSEQKEMKLKSKATNHYGMHNQRIEVVLYDRGT